jgi:hypothetical protein
MMSEGYAGARVNYCGHDGYFVADVLHVAGAIVVRATGPVSAQNIIRPGSHNYRSPTHTMVDFPEAGFWRPDLGVFVVPAGQVKKTKEA